MDDVQGDTSGYIKRLLFSQCNAARNEESEGVDDGLAAEEAQEIYDVSGNYNYGYMRVWAGGGPEMILLLRVYTCPSVYVTAAVSIVLHAY